MGDSMDLGNSAYLFFFYRKTKTALEFGWLNKEALIAGFFLSTHIVVISPLSGQWGKFELILTS
jgi:hypothetical protein